MKLTNLLIVLVVMIISSCGQNVREEGPTDEVVNREARDQFKELSSHQNDIQVRVSLPDDAKNGTQVLIENGEIYKRSEDRWIFIRRIGAGFCNILKSAGIPSDSLGDVGECFVDKSTGDFYQKKINGWVFIYNLKGDKGDKGNDANQWHIFEGKPSDSVGNDNDFGLDILSSNIYAKVNGEWVLKGKLASNHTHNHDHDYRVEPVVIEPVVVEPPVIVTPPVVVKPPVVIVPPVVVEKPAGYCNVDGEQYMKMEKMSEKLLSTLNVSTVLPYKSASSKFERVKLETLVGLQKNHELNGKKVVKDAQVVFGYKIPDTVMDFDDQDIKNSSLIIDLNIKKHSFDESTLQTEQICVFAKCRRTCSGNLFAGDWLDIVNTSFYGENAGPINSKFSDDLFKSSRNLVGITSEKSQYHLIKSYHLNELLGLTIQDLVDMKKKGIDDFYIILTDDLTSNTYPEILIHTKSCK